MTEKKPKRKVERRAVAKVINVQPPRPADDLFNPFAEAKRAESAASVPEYRSTGVPDSPHVQVIKEHSPVTEAPQYRGTAVPESKFYKKANEAADHLDRRLTPAESKVFEQIVRLTVGFQVDERQVRISVLQERTGYGSDKTVREALKGLEGKGVIARLGRPNNSGGITYKILSYSGTPVPQHSGTPAESTPVPRVEITGELKTDLKEQNTDDEAFAKLRAAAKELTGKEAKDWQELDEVLTTELRIAAGRTTVSSVPAFLAEHLRRRLWKKDAAQLKAETESSPQGQGTQKTPIPEGVTCPDCSNTGMWYPEGFDKGVARCSHLRLRAEGDGG